MVTIRALTPNDIGLFRPLITGYTSTDIYKVVTHQSDDLSYFRLELTKLVQPYQKVYDLEDDDYYHDILTAGLSLGVYDGDALIAIALSDIAQWNKHFWLHEFHVHPAHQGRDIGQQLMTAVITKAQETDCRLIVCETQNTNVPAIRFYRNMGFSIEGIDTSLYVDLDEVAVFMKYHLR